ncbi:centromere protein H (CENP-H)-domain-containing protein [Talaromyces proteolyticus]|uniref:Centromere protein H (CENP-H)-domain-containing protein n=1 Tax=Talaromyces proteolyticus TaxID=1131652 RepID=A0AAD4KIZ2_9EURO|nr:centromere protein H (CENP-H)-domain-containing protein [Talaromyces proteolyticus]KAH8692630.1 centromere protein H (CENP-H)-domain-containing protein [Talaromyces proteolyticus]
MASNDSAGPPSYAAGFDEPEAVLLELAADNSQDELELSSKEQLLLRLYDQIQELDLEQAVLEQGMGLFGDLLYLGIPLMAHSDPEQPRNENVDEQLRVAERELLEARATYTVRRRAIESVLMTDPILKAVHLRASTPAERALLPLINRRDLLSLIYENLSNAQAAILETRSNAEVDNIRATKLNQELARQLLGLTAKGESWRDDVKDNTLQSQIEETEQQHKKARSQWDIMKNIVSAVIVSSGVDWARDDRLRELVLDELD